MTQRNTENAIKSIVIDQFKQYQREQMREVAKAGRKAFRAKFKTKAELSAYMKKLSNLRKKRAN